MKFGFIAKHRGIWAVDWMCGSLGVSRGGFYAWLTRPRSRRSLSDEEVGAKVRASFLASDRTYGARRVWHDMLADGIAGGLHRIERLMRLQALKARPRRRRLPPDLGERQVAAIAANVSGPRLVAPAPNRKWIADFTYVWTAEGSARRGRCHRSVLTTCGRLVDERSDDGAARHQPVAERLGQNGLEPLVRIVFDRSIARCVGDAPVCKRLRSGSISSACPSMRSALLKTELVSLRFAI